MDELEERIRQRAYQFWQAEGCPEGLAPTHWERARQSIESESQSEVSNMEQTAPAPAGKVRP